MKVEKSLTVIEYGYTLQMASLAYIILKFGRQPPRIYYGIIRAFRCIYGFVVLPLLHVQAAGAMTPLAIDTVFYRQVFIFAVAYKVRIGIMAAHALYLYQPLKPAAGTFFKTRRQVPPV